MKSAIKRCYQELGFKSTNLDVATLAGLRALTQPYDLSHITRNVVRSLILEGFQAFWDKTGVHGSQYVVHIDWRAALKHARNAGRRASQPRPVQVDNLRVRRLPISHRFCNQEHAADGAGADDMEGRDIEVLALDLLVNPAKVRQNGETSPLLEN